MTTIASHRTGVSTSALVACASAQTPITGPVMRMLAYETESAAVQASVH